jgi:hypothetical protein
MHSEGPVTTWLSLEHGITYTKVIHWYRLSKRAHWVSSTQPMLTRRADPPPLSIAITFTTDIGLSGLPSESQYVNPRCLISPSFLSSAEDRTESKSRSAADA